MNAPAKIKEEADEPITGLALLRQPFAAHHISKLPKPTKKQTDEVRDDVSKGVRCQICGGWHHPKVVHLDYVGHAALTDRLLDTDPLWSWEPLALRDGLPAFDGTGGLWIKLTVCGVTRLGYGHAAGKATSDPGAREKEVIGDALRNAAMRFGAALDLWHKGDLHAATSDANGHQEANGDGRVINPKTGRKIDPMSPNQARQDGRGARYDTLRHEITDLTAVTDCIAWGIANKAEIDKWPEAWRNDIRKELSDHMGTLRALAAKEAGADLDTGEILDGDDIPDFPGDRPRAEAAL